MRKTGRFAALALVIALLFGFGAAWAEEKEEIELYILSCNEELEETSDVFQAYQMAADNLGYKYNLEVIDDETYKTKIRVMLQANELPDIFYTWGGSYSESFIAASALYPVEQAIQDSGYKFFDTYTQPAADGHLYWVANASFEAYCLYYNKDVLKKVGVEPPATWDELVAAIDACNKAGVPALGLGNKDRWEGDLVYNMLVLRQDQKAFENAAKGEASFKDEPFKAAAQQVLDLVQMNGFQSGYTQATNDECAQLLLAGEIAMYPSGPWLLSTYNKVDTIGFVPFPATGKEDARAASCGNANDAGLCVSANSKHPYEAARFAVEYAKCLNDLYAKAGQLTFMETDVKPDAPMTELMQSYADYLQGLQFTQLWWYTHLDTALGEPMRDLSQQLFAGDIDAQSFVDNLDAIMQG
jgi:raffinose/stachyose/melibiose transport system substrate-binding protein